ncbi:hypothetical protein AB8Q38_03330 [Klebsiella quasipneumoniae]|uniref:Mu prophage protein n=1 Tax=Klebsiella michiganensis TaxID=1134687 RepID=A0AB35WAF3_9ENTR|nr:MULTISPECIES: hypothetical protein [Klebsiella]APM34718.1 hypothetical protein AGH21_30825 [Klebsiella oxytoca]MDQ5139786.1 hypothetical protein [Klebsiella pneumoniae]MDQ5326130.1 hypothetical protein [Klebsiella pneumoniae]MDU7230961.1 hypothetical protein [Klebsiella pneumoniae]MEC6051246.1 hypothetical protein [Klebsiella michiganensis]
MGKGWDSSLRAGRRDRLRQEVLHRVAGGPPPVPLDYKGCDGTHASYYRRGWDSVDTRDIVWQCQRYKEKHNV